MFRVCDIAHAPVPACAAALAFVALILGRAGLALRANSAGPRPPGRVFTVDHMAR